MSEFIFIIVSINLVIFFGLFIYVAVKLRRSEEEIKKMKHDKNIADRIASHHYDWPPHKGESK